MLQSFIASQFIAAPGGVVTVKQLVLAFRRAHPQEATRWPRGRILSALAGLGYKTALDREGVAVVVGLAANAPVAVADGRLV